MVFRIAPAPVTRPPRPRPASLRPAPQPPPRAGPTRPCVSVLRPHWAPTGRCASPASDFQSPVDLSTNLPPPPPKTYPIGLIYSPILRLFQHKICPSNPFIQILAEKYLRGAKHGVQSARGQCPVSTGTISGGAGAKTTKLQVPVADSESRTRKFLAEL